MRRTRPQAPGEYLLRLVHIYPFQCQVCSHRFTKYQAEEQRAQQASDRRSYDRVATALRVTIGGNTRAGEGVASDLSMDGCSLRTATTLAVGDELKLSLHPEGDAEPIVIERAVIRSIKPSMSGVQFLQFAVGGRERLSRIVRKMLGNQRASA